MLCVNVFVGQGQHTSYNIKAIHFIWKPTDI